MDADRTIRNGGSTSLREYGRKRDFAITSEPPAASRRQTAKDRVDKVMQFVVQKHDARRLHYDFRLELDGVLKSWAVPKGPSLDPKVKRLAVHVEDHPVAYAGFEGHIPHGQYGAGDVIVWDRGRWEAVDADPAAAYRAGRLKFRLFGEKLSGGWTLVRTRLRGSGDKEQWLLIKENDAAARSESGFDITVARPDSILNQDALPAGKRRTGPPDPATDRDAPTLEGAKPDVLPETMAPELATLVREAPVGNWRYEVKFDGYRLLTRVDGGAVTLLTRSGLDWTRKLESLADAVRSLELASGWLDGEIVVLDSHGLPDFQALQNAFEEGRSEGRGKKGSGGSRGDGGDSGDSGRREIVYYLFDIPFCDGLDLRAVPLEQRRALLKRLLRRGDSERLRYSEDFSAPTSDILSSACELELEGLIGKRVGSPYVSRRSADWIKLKCKQRQEFVIGGLTAPQGSRSGFGALLLGVRDAADLPAGLRYVGRVGTGFTEASLKSLHGRMQSLIRPSSPFADPPTGREATGVTWLEPRLLCEVEFAAWTDDGRVRQAVFRGLRDDKPAEAVRETAAPDRPKTGQSSGSAVRSGKQRSRAQATIAGITISHPDRVIDTKSGMTKLALAKFYHDIAPRLLPHLAGRPLSLVRAPEGVAGEQFFQRHAGTLDIPGMRLHRQNNEQLMEIPTVEALIGAVQMGAIEFHTWNANLGQLAGPNRAVFDLDPDPALPWSRMVEATQLVVALLDELGLKAFLKTSGGKGMHVVVPLARHHDWEPVKAFSRAVTEHFAHVLPKRFAARMGPRNRVGKIYIDYLRNQKGGTTVAAYSVRARPGLGVSVPVGPDEVERIKGSDAWTVLNLAERLDRLEKHGDDPWADYAQTQRITRAMMERLGLKPGLK